MEIIIRDKIKELLTTSTTISVNDNVVKEIVNHMKSWDNLEDYPILVVTYSLIDTPEEQIGAANMEYHFNIWILNAMETFEEMEAQRNLLKKRVLSVLRTYHTLDRLTDNSNNEKVYSSIVRGVDFDEDGYEGRVLGLARIQLSVFTDKLKPY